MKYKTLLAVCLLAFVGSLMTACTTPGGSSASGATPAQIAAAVCPIVQTDLTTYQALFASGNVVPNSAKISADLAKAEPVVAALCAAGATVSVANVQAFANTALPALADTINYLPLSASQKSKILQDLSIAELAVGVVGVVESQIQPGLPAPATTTAVVK